MKSPQPLGSQTYKISNYNRISRNKISSRTEILNENVEDIYKKLHNNKIGSIVTSKYNHLQKCNIPQKASELNNIKIKSTRKSYHLVNNNNRNSSIKNKQTKSIEDQQSNIIFIKYKSYKKSKNQKYNKNSICLSRTKDSAINLISEKKYFNKNNDQNKAFFYKDICVTGDKIAIWKKLKKRISSLTSTTIDSKIKAPVPKQVDSKNRQFKETIRDDIKKIKSKPFRQIFWNMYCKCSFSKTKNCSILPLIQFPETPDHCLYKKCSCILQGENKYVFHKLHYSHSGKISPKIGISDITIDNSKILINVKSSSTKIKTSCKEIKSTCTENKTLEKEQIDDMILDKRKKEICSQKLTSKTRQVKCNDAHTEVEGDFILHDNTPNKIKCTKEQLIEYRCKKTQKDEEIGCGDKINNLKINNQQNNIPLLKKNKDCKYDQVKMFLRSFKQINSRSNFCKNLEKEAYADDNLIARKNRFRKPNRKLINSIGIQCNSSLMEYSKLKKGQKKILVKEKVCNKSYRYNLPVPRLNTMGNQCNLIKQPVCKLNEQKTSTKSRKRSFKKTTEGCECNNLVTFINCTPTKNVYDICKPYKKYFCMKKPLYTSVGTQCSIITTSISECNNTKGNKFWSRKIPLKKTECIVVTPRSCKDTKNKSCKKCRFFKLAFRNSIGLEKTKYCTCTKYLYNSKSCDNLCCRKLPVPCSSVGTQRNSVYFHQPPKRLRLTNKQNWSPFNLKTSKSGKTCSCVRSLMCIDDAYKNYYVKSALISPCKQPKALYKENCCYYSRDRGDYSDDTKLKITSNPHCCITKEEKNKCTNAAPCRGKCCHDTCPIYKRKNRASFIESYFSNCHMTPRQCRPMYLKSRCEPSYSPYCKPRACKHLKKCKKQTSCKRHKTRPYCSDKCRKKKKTSCKCRYIKKFIQLLLCLGRKTCVCRRKCKKPIFDGDRNRIFMKTLRRAPCQSIYRLFPWAYPECLSCLGLCKQNVQCILVIVTWIVWCPFIVFMELFRLCFCYFR